MLLKLSDGTVRAALPGGSNWETVLRPRSVSPSHSPARDRSPARPWHSSPPQTARGPSRDPPETPPRRRGSVDSCRSATPQAPDFPRLGSVSKGPGSAGRASSVGAGPSARAALAESWAGLRGRPSTASLPAAADSVSSLRPPSTVGTAVNTDPDIEPPPPRSAGGATVRLPLLEPTVDPPRPETPSVLAALQAAALPRRPSRPFSDRRATVQFPDTPTTTATSSEVTSPAGVGAALAMPIGRASVAAPDPPDVALARAVGALGVNTGPLLRRAAHIEGIVRQDLAAVLCDELEYSSAAAWALLDDLEADPHTAPPPGGYPATTATRSARRGSCSAAVAAITDVVVAAAGRPRTADQVALLLGAGMEPAQVATMCIKAGAVDRASGEGMAYAVQWAPAARAALLPRMLLPLDVAFAALGIPVWLLPLYLAEERRVPLLRAPPAFGASASTPTPPATPDPKAISVSATPTPPRVPPGGRFPGRPRCTYVTASTQTEPESPEVFAVGRALTSFAEDCAPPASPRPGVIPGRHDGHPRSRGGSTMPGVVGGSRASGVELPTFDAGPGSPRSRLGSVARSFPVATEVAFVTPDDLPAHFTAEEFTDLCHMHAYTCDRLGPLLARKLLAFDDDDDEPPSPVAGPDPRKLSLRRVSQQLVATARLSIFAASKRRQTNFVGFGRPKEDTPGRRIAKRLEQVRPRPWRPMPSEEDLLVGNIAPATPSVQPAAPTAAPTMMRTTSVGFALPADEGAPTPRASKAAAAPAPPPEPPAPESPAKPRRHVSRKPPVPGTTRARMHPADKLPTPALP